ncbi:hypothetical protein HNP46_004167 [Pseudomonas nitritireducens]|uniref:HD Cas3-type domain-containing protein n=1 Tax=Pseudomonas nitroreducens TaxID=46680 RepID=A0A7W7KM22_PSENT|nr:hypothetical protein [Pseudomonas nitritireducens]MBB4865286.1 hypothetical protein [Pseudomonas nitritireducens]
MEAPLARYLSLAVRLAGLFHDLGKGTYGFSEKLSDAVAGTFGPDVRVKDPLRHELVSALLIDVDAPDDALYQLQTPGGVVAFFEVRRQTLASQETRQHVEAMLARCITLAEKGREQVTDGDLEFFHQHMSLNRPHAWERHPFWMSVLWLVLTHHKLPAGAWSMRHASFTLLPARHVGLHQHMEEGHHHIRNLDRLGRFMQMPGTGQPWHSSEWVQAVASTVRELLALRVELPSVESEMFQAGEGEFGSGTPWLSLLTRVGRASLVIADYEASCDAVKPAFTGNPEGLVFANTKDTGARYVYGDTLERHLLRVGQLAPTVLEGLLEPGSGQTFSALALRPSEVPPGFALPENIPDSPYAWQAHAQRAFEEFRATTAGLFCLVAAGTGRGKTRACAAMMGSCRPEARFSVMLSMRSLTFQTAAAYVGERIGFRPDQVAMFVGDDVLKRRFRILQAEETQAYWRRAPGTEHGLDDPWEAQQEVMYTGPLRASSPLNCIRNDGFLMRLLSAPVSVMTVDHVIRLIDLKSSKDILPLMHLLSSDLVLDEIDDYKGDDLICIGRLIELAGQCGRRVIIASATLPRTVAENFHAAYLSGYRVFQQLNGAPAAQAMVVTHLAPFVSHQMGTSFGEFYSQVMAKFCEEERQSAISAPRRQVLNTEMLLDKALGGLSPASFYKHQIADAQNAFYGATTWLARLAHKQNHLVDPATKLAYSVGFIRLNTVKSVQGYVRWMIDSPFVDKLRDHGVVVKVLCYHAQNLGVVRVLQESFLERHLARTRMNKGQSDPFLDHPDVKAALEASWHAGDEDVIFIIATSSIMETGRDFDHDWCILEPCSTQSIVQAGGRVRRHRLAPHPHPNVLVLPVSLDGLIVLEHAWRDMKFSPYVPRERPRAPYKGAMDELGVCHVDGLPRMPCTAREAFSAELNRGALHAGHCLETPAAYRLAPLTVMERVRQLGLFQRRHAEEGREPYTLQYSVEQADALLCSAVYEQTPFRGQDESAQIQYLREHQGWFVMDAAERVTPGNGVVSCAYSRPAEDELFMLPQLNLRSEEQLLALSECTAGEIGYQPEDLSLAEAALLSCQRRANFKQLVFDPQLGFYEPGPDR